MNHKKDDFSADIDQKTEQKCAMQELELLKEQMSSILAAQEDIKNQINMIFADISQFENMVLKIMDQALTSKTNSETLHH